jgi:NADH-quinone oxidoreductase subunit D
VGTNGDSFDRYVIRLEEIRQSVSLIIQCINKLPEGSVSVSDSKFNSPGRSDMKLSMEALIHHFK